MGAFDDLIPQDKQNPEQPNSSSNTGAFNDLIPKSQEEVAMSEQQAKPKTSSFMAMVEGFDRAIGRTAEGENGQERIK